MHSLRPVSLRSNLTTLENALLWTMRAWVIGHCQRVDVAHRIETVFDQLGAPEAAASLGGFMSALSQGAKRVLEVNCVCCPDVSEDEAALLRVVALQQEEAHEEAFAVLSDMTVERATASACDNGYRLILALNSAGHTLPRHSLSRSGGTNLHHLRGTFSHPRGASPSHTLH